MSKIIKRNPAPAPGEERISDLWRTERTLFTALNSEFGFDVDLAANAENHLLPRWLGAGGLHENALTCDWLALADLPEWDALGGVGASVTGFLNPPYSSALIVAFMAKAAAEARRGFTTVALVPYTPGTKWWATMEAAATEIRSLPHRVAYLKPDVEHPGKLKPAGAMFDSAVVVLRPQPGIIRGDARRATWSYRLPKVKAARLPKGKAV